MSFVLNALTELFRCFKMRLQFTTEEIEMSKNDVASTAGFLPYEAKIINSLYDLANKVEKANDSATAEKIRQSAKDLADQIRNAKVNGYSSNLKATLGGLDLWVNNYNKYAYTSEVGEDYARGIGTVGKDQWKCNRFVADAMLRRGAAVGTTKEGGSTSNRYRYPAAGNNPSNYYPVSAEDLVSSKPIDNTKIIPTKDGKMGDIVGIPPGHCGIYLGNGLYVSATTAVSIGGQVADGVKIGKLDFKKKPVFRRFEGVPARYEQLSSSNISTSDNLTASTADSLTNEVKDEILKMYTIDGTSDSKVSDVAVMIRELQENSYPSQYIKSILTAYYNKQGLLSDLIAQQVSDDIASSNNTSSRSTTGLQRSAGGDGIAA
jgi:hypothetical protein